MTTKDEFLSLQQTIDKKAPTQADIERTQAQLKNNPDLYSSEICGAD